MLFLSHRQNGDVTANLQSSLCSTEQENQQLFVFICHATSSISTWVDASLSFCFMKLCSSEHDLKSTFSTRPHESQMWLQIKQLPFGHVTGSLRPTEAAPIAASFSKSLSICNIVSFNSLPLQDQEKYISVLLTCPQVTWILPTTTVQYLQCFKLILFHGRSFEGHRLRGVIRLRSLWWELWPAGPTLGNPGLMDF